MNRLVTGLAAIVMITLGLYIALGSFQMLGLQFPAASLSVTDPHASARHDSNVGLLGGIFAGAGLLVLASDRFVTPRPKSAVLLALRPAGGLARPTRPEYAMGADHALLPSHLAEFLLAPAPALRVWRSSRGEKNHHAP